MKKIKMLPLIALMSVFGLTGCDKANYKIGVLLPVEHAALQACTDGFVEGLKESGLTQGVDFSVTIRNAGGNSADLTSYAKRLVKKFDMTFGLGTDASKQLKSASIDKGVTKPVLFSAVTDPVGAGLVEQAENGSGFVTGSSDAQPIGDQIALIKECIPSADKIGILYTESETNSVVQADQAEQFAQQAGLTVIRKTVSGAADINSIALNLCSEDGIDAIYVPTDNNLAAHMNDVLTAANAKHVLIVAGEEGMLKDGAHITLSIDYVELGKIAGKYAAAIIKGEKQPFELPVATMSSEDCTYVCSTANLAATGIELAPAIIAKCEDISK